jgi:hypothetical protein
LANERWNINGELQENLSYISNRLLPSTAIFLRYKHLDRSKFTDSELLFFHQNTCQMGRMFDMNVDDNGDFDGW